MQLFLLTFVETLWYGTGNGFESVNNCGSNSCYSLRHRWILFFFGWGAVMNKTKTNNGCVSNEVLDIGSVIDTLCS
jgi:hypothetical protein